MLHNFIYSVGNEVDSSDLLKNIHVVLTADFGLL